MLAGKAPRKKGRVSKAVHKRCGGGPFQNSLKDSGPFRKQQETEEMGRRGTD